MIETVGEVVRGRNGCLVQIIEVLEWTRLPDSHLTAPGDVVVRVQPHGPGYGYRSAWASELTPSQPGDVGVHLHRADCPCGAPSDMAEWYVGVHVRANWTTS